jgi:hypothetical protein
MFQVFPNLLQLPHFTWNPKLTSPQPGRWNYEEWKVGLSGLVPVTKDTIDTAWDHLEVAFKHFRLTAKPEFKDVYDQCKILQFNSVLISFRDSPDEANLLEYFGMYTDSSIPDQSSGLFAAELEKYDYQSHFIERKNEEPAVTAGLELELRRLASDYLNGKFRLPYTALTQASGMGKSFHVSQLRKTCWLFYASVQSPKMGTFPQSSSIAPFLLDPAKALRHVHSLSMKEDGQLNPSFTGLAYRCFFTACFFELESWILERAQGYGMDVCGSLFPREVLEKLQDEWGILQLNPESENVFWDRILDRTNKILAYFASTFPGNFCILFYH